MKKTNRISLVWQPCLAAKSQLLQAGFDKDTIQMQRNRFVLHYWMFSDEQPSVSYDTVFYRYMTEAYDPDAPAKSTDAVPISEDWKPSQAAYDALDRLGIGQDFAETQIKAFVLYWHEQGCEHRDWNSRFAQHVRYQHDQEVEKRSGRAQRETDKKSYPSIRGGSTRDRSLEEDLTDTSWAR